MRNVIHAAAALAALVAAAPPARAQEPAPPPLRIDYTHPVHGLSAPILLVLRQKGVPAPTGTFVLSTDEGPSNPRARFVGSNVPDSVLPLVNRVIGNFLLAQRSTAPITLSFRLDNPANAELQGAPMGGSGTPPELKNRAEIHRLMRAMLQAHPEAAILQRANASLRMWVDSEGRVAYVILDRRTGEELDTYLLSLGYEYLFRPATVDGQRVNAWVLSALEFTGDRFGS